MNGLDGRPLDWDGTLVLPSGMRTYSNDILGSHARRVFGGDPGLVLVLYDVWAIEPAPLREFAAAAWTPIQSHPVPPADLEFFQVSGTLPIAMSRYGERELREAGLQPVYVPHAVDTSIFKPLDDSDRATAREMLGVPADAFVIAIVAANKDKTPPRKAWGEQFQAFAVFHQRHPDARLLVHTLLETPTGVNLMALVYDLGIAEHVQFTDQYAQVAGLYGPHDMAALYGCADVLSNCSYGEGFGLPVLEAQACGTPVVVSDGSALTELCGSGWLVGTQPYWHPYARSWWHTPIIDQIVAGWEQAYTHARDPEVRARAREFALDYDADIVLTQWWKPALEMLEQYAGAAPVRPPTRNHGAVPLPTVEADGLRWFQRGGNTDDWIAVNHEESLTPILDGLLPAGGVFVDVGAHVGRWSLRLAAKASRVIAVEANPATAAVLRAHIALNDVGNVDVLELAAWDSEIYLNLADPNGKVTGGSTRVTPVDDAAMALVKDGFTAESVVDAVKNDDWGRLKHPGLVPARPLDAVLGEVSPDLVKLDVEGADLHAIRGLASTLARARPVLFIEDHSIYGYYEKADLENLLREMDYSWKEIAAFLSGGRSAPYIVAVPNDEGRRQASFFFACRNDSL